MVDAQATATASPAPAMTEEGRLQLPAVQTVLAAAGEASCRVQPGSIYAPSSSAGSSPRSSAAGPTMLSLLQAQGVIPMGPQGAQASQRGSPTWSKDVSPSATRVVAVHGTQAPFSAFPADQAAGVAHARHSIALGRGAGAGPLPPEWQVWQEQYERGLYVQEKHKLGQRSYPQAVGTKSRSRSAVPGPGRGRAPDRCARCAQGAPVLRA